MSLNLFNFAFEKDIILVKFSIFISVPSQMSIINPLICSK
jgi:hypothetical protein